MFLSFKRKGKKKKLTYIFVKLFNQDETKDKIISKYNNAKQMIK
jgi:hypothetical protein